MTATRQDVVVEQGVTFEYTVDLFDADGQPRTDLGGKTGTMQIRTEQNGASALIATATVTVDTVNSQATATIADSVTASLDFSAGWYDFDISGGGRSERVAEGRATFSRTVNA